MSHITMSRPRSVVGWTVLAGIVAGLLAAVYFSIAGEPAIDDAIAIEESVAAAGGDDHGHGEGDGHGHSHGGDDEVVARGTQRGAGLFGAYAVTGAAFGLLLAVTALTLRGPWLDPFRRFLVAGAVLAVAITVAPWFKYPPNPPAVGEEGTVGERQLAYWALVLLSGLLLAGAAHLSGRLRRAGWGQPQRAGTVGLAALAAVGLLLVAMPAGDVTIPAEMPASLVWRFRTASLVGNLLLWGLLTVGMGVAYSAATSRETPRAADQNSMPLSADTPLS